MHHLLFDTNRPGNEGAYKIERISASMAGTYSMCPLAFYYGYIAKIEIEQTRIHLLFGSAIHKALENYYNEDDNYLDAYKEMFTREELDDEGKAMFSEYYPLGLEMIRNMVELYPTLTNTYQLKPGKTEAYFRRDIYHPITGEALRIPMSGVTDLVSESGRIVDYKTSKLPWNVNDVKFKIQCHFYNLWFFSEHNRIADETLFFIMLKKYKLTAREEVIQILSYKPTIEELAMAWEEIDAMIDKIEAGMFERPTENHPRYCDCYKYEKLLNIKS